MLLVRVVIVRHRLPPWLIVAAAGYAWSLYTAARWLAGRNAHTMLRVASNDSVWAPASVDTLS